MDIKLWLTLITLYFLNGIMFYYIIYNITNPRKGLLSNGDTINRPKITFKKLLIGLGYGLSMGTIYYLTGDHEGLNALVTLIFTVGVIYVIKLVTKENIINSALVYSMKVLVIMLLQEPFLIALNAFGLIITAYTGLIIQIILLAPVIYFYKYSALHELYLFIKMSMTLANMTFVFATVTVIIMVHFSSPNNFPNYTWWYAGLSIISAIAFYILTTRTMKLSDRLHVTENLLEGLNFLLLTEDNTKKVQAHYTKSLKHFGYDIPDMKSFNPKKHEENLQTSIESKKKKYQSKADVITNINYYYENDTVPIPILIQMLGTLLDNSFDTKTKKPIFVDITVAQKQLEITIANASDRKTPTEIDLMFGKKHSTKQGDRGYGLSKLLMTVKNYWGEIDAFCEYRKEHKSHYLSISIKINGS